MTDHGVNQPVVDAFLLQKLLFFSAMLIRPPLEIQIVQDAGGFPEVRLFFVSEPDCVPAQNVADDVPVFSVEFPLIVFAQ